MQNYITLHYIINSFCKNVQKKKKAATLFIMSGRQLPTMRKIIQIIIRTR